MCATVCPSQALFFGTREQVRQLRPRSVPTNQFRFGNQTITTRVSVMVPRGGAGAAAPGYVDVTAAMDERARPRSVSLGVLPDGGQRGPTAEGETGIAAGMGSVAAMGEDPFAGVEV